MHLYNDLDIDVWGYVTTAPFGDVVLEDALKTIRPDMALRGNIDQVEFMIKATPAQVKERIKELLDQVKSRGNWILCTSDFFFDGTSYDNIRRLPKPGWSMVNIERLNNEPGINISKSVSTESTKKLNKGNHNNEY